MTKSIAIILLSIFTSISACHGQQPSNKMQQNNNGALLCDPEEGVCEIPGHKATAHTTAIPVNKKTVKIVYFTDPICSSCWGIEPQLRKLKLEYGDYFDIDYRMGGLLPDWSYNSGGISKPSDVAEHWDEVSAYYQMPIDGDVWLEDPLPSSYPPSIAFKATQMQDEHKAIDFLRRIREMVFLEKRNITKWEYIAQAAQETGLDTQKLKTDYEGKAKELFREDLDYARKLGVRGFPTMFFADSLGNQIMVYGSKPYEAFENALLKMDAKAKKKNIDTDFEALFNRFPTLTAKEYAVLTNVSLPDAEKELNRNVEEKKLTKMITKNGSLWIYSSLK